MGGGGPGFVGEEEDVAEHMDDSFTVVDFPDDHRTGTSCWPLLMKDDGSLGAEKPVDEYRAGESHGLSSDFVNDTGETQRKEEVGEKEELEEEQEEIMKAEEINSVVVGEEKEEEKYNHVRQLEGEEDGDDDDINDADGDVDDDDDDEAEKEEEEEEEGEEEEEEEEGTDSKYESFEVEVAVNTVAFDSSKLSVGVTPMNFGTDKKKMKVYQSLMNNYQLSKRNRDAYRGLKSDILRYKPGCYVIERDGVDWCDYEIPQITTLLLVGPRGSGKSRLVNSILRMFERENGSTGRAAVSCKLTIQLGMVHFFLQEYDFPLNSPSFCVYDTRSLSQDMNENLENIKEWMVAGVCHGAPVLRKSDDAETRKAILCRGRQLDHLFNRVKEVNFVIFVVSGLSVIEAMRNGDNKYFDKLAKNFNCPYLSFKDDKPVLVVTHGDLLDISERVLVRMQLGEVLGVSPLNIYDIPDKWDTATRLSIVGMLVDALDHAENNLSFKRKGLSQSFKVPLLNMVMLLLELLLLGLIILYLSSYFRRDQVPEWHNIRHLWLG